MRKIKQSSRSGCLCGVALCLSLACGFTDAFAQENLPTAAASDQLTEVLVTATRQSTTVQTTPITITALTGEELSVRGITDLGDLVSSVPAIAVRNSGGPGQMEFEIRGLNSQGGNSSMVGLYLGEIPLSTMAFSQLGAHAVDSQLYDLQRVEVLTGPQGTLYGSSSMGGTIRLLPNPPQLNTYTASADAWVSGTASGGGINHTENGMFNFPLGNTAAVRIVGSLVSDSGWIDRRVIADGAVPVDAGAFPAVSRPSNFYTAPLQESLTGVNTTLVDSIRAEILWQPLENFTIRPLAMYQLVQQGAPPAVDVNGTPTHPQVPAEWAHYEVFDAPEPQTDSLSFGSLTMVYQLPTFSLTSATGFWHRNVLLQQDSTEQVASAVGIPVYDASQGGFGPNYSTRGPGFLNQEVSRQWSEEFRLTSTAPGPVQWVAGYFYQDLYSEYNSSTLAPQATALLGGDNLYTGFAPETLIQNAFYGNLSWRVSQHFAADAGFRYYHFALAGSNTNSGLFSVNGARGVYAPSTFEASNRASGTVPSFTLTYNIDPDRMVFTRIGKGFRLGGINGAFPVAPASNTNPLFAADVADECGLQAKLLLTTTCKPNLLLTAPTTFASDSLWSYELGLKSAFFDHRLIANLSVYLEDWYNPQLATFVAGEPLNVNGGNARIKGIEGQLQSLLPGGFDLSLSASYVDAQFVESSAITGYPAGTQIPDTPRWSASAVLQWKHQLANDRSLFGVLEANYEGTRTDLPYGVTSTLLTTDGILVHLPSYTLANFRFGIRGELQGGNHWSAALFVDNFTNNHVLLDPQPQLTLQTGAFERYVLNQPLTAGINVSYGFR